MMLDHSYNETHRNELFLALNKEFLWTFILSGLNHEAFQGLYKKLIPSSALQLNQIIDIIKEAQNPIMDAILGLNATHY